MNYKKHYEQLIERAQARELTGYTEKHHIIPRCLGGSNDASNLVVLTPEEHYVAHQLLVKIHPNNKKLLYAAMMMQHNSGTMQRNNKIYSWLRKKFAAQRKKDTTGSKNPSYGTKWYHCPVTLKAVKVRPNDRPTGYVSGRKPVVVKNKLMKRCKKCGSYVCSRPDVCKRAQLIKRLVCSFGFEKNAIGTANFYAEYDRVVESIRKSYITVALKN